MTVTEEEMKKACDTVFSFIMERDNQNISSAMTGDAVGLIESPVVEYLSSENIEKLTSIKFHHEITAKLATNKNLTEKAVSNIKKKSASRAVYMEILKNKHIPVEWKDQFLDKNMIKHILKDSPRYWYQKKSRANVSYDDIKDKLPEDVLKLIDRHRDVYDIIV